MNVVSLKPIIDLGFTFLDGLIVTVLVPAAGYYVLRLLHIQSSSVLGQRILTAASNGAALALSKGQALADAHSTVDIKSAQIAVGVQYVQTALPGALKAAGITPGHLANIVESQLQKAQMAPTLPVATAPATQAAAT